MRGFLFRCRNTGHRFQGFVAEEASENSENYEMVKSIACEQTHLVNPATRKVLGVEHE
jgi:hypothetical protein